MLVGECQDMARVEEVETLDKGDQEGGGYRSRSMGTERGWRGKKKSGARGRALGSTHFEGTRKRSRRGPPERVASPSSWTLVPGPGVMSTGGGGLEKEQCVPARAIAHGNEGT